MYFSVKYYIKPDKIKDMDRILSNQIIRCIHIHHPGSQATEVVQRIRTEVYKDREKTFTRVINNTSQPTLLETITIAKIIGTSVEEIIAVELATT
jgi:hypothetical protein